MRYRDSKYQLDKNVELDEAFLKVLIQRNMMRQNLLQKRGDEEAKSKVRLW